MPQSCSDRSTMAFMRIMPSVCAPLGALISEPFFTCTSPGIVLKERFSVGND